MLSNTKERRWQQDLYRLSIITLITVVIWIGTAVYKALSKNQVKPEVKKLSLPLTPSLDIDTMEKIKQRQTTPPIDWESLKPAKPVILMLPEATISGKIYESKP